MKKRNILSIVLFLLIGLQLGLAQEKPQAELIDEFANPECCDLGARIDGLIVSVIADNQATGYIVIHGNKANLWQSLTLESWAKGQLLKPARNGYQKRFIVVRGEMEEKETRIQLWKVPQGADLPFLTKANWDFTFFNIKKTEVFYSNVSSDGVICLSVEQIKLFAAVLQSNSNLKGHIILYETSKKGFIEQKQSLLKFFTDEFQIPQERLRFFYVKKDLNKYMEEEGIYELWLIPIKKS